MSGKCVRILNAEPLGYCPAARDILSSFSELHEEQLSRESLLAAVGEYDALIVRLGHKIDDELLSRAGRLKAVATATTGLNHIDLETAKSRGISVISLRGETAFLREVTATAELTFGLILSLARNISSAAHSVSIGGGWDRDSFRGVELKDKTLGIVGLGRLGSRVAGYGLAFGMDVIAFDTADVTIPGVRNTSIEEVCSASDFITIHIPYDKSNEQFINADKIALMKKTAFLINTSRGEVLDETALLSALESRKIAGAALDVLSDENSGSLNWRDTDPLIAFASKHPGRLIITPHIGGCTSDSMQKTEIFIANKLRYFFSED